MSDPLDNTVTAETRDQPEASAAASEASDPQETSAAAATAAEPVAADSATPVEAKTEEAEAPEAAPIEAEDEAGDAESATTADAQTEAEASPAPAEAEKKAGAEETEAEEKAVEVETKAEESEAKAEGAGEAAVEAEAVESEAKTEGSDKPEAKTDDAEAALEADGMMAELAKAMAEKRSVEGKIIGWNKGGYHVAIDKIAAFCPVSQIEIGNPRSPKRYLDKTFPFRVIEIQKGGRRVVVSRAEALKAERKERAARVRETLKPGAELEGRVSSLTDFGAFVDVGGGIEGLVHVSEISRRRVEHPKEVLKTGQKVKVAVLKIEKGGRRISLSMKRLEPDPWKGVAERFPAGSEFKGKILRKTDFGLFVEVEPGLEGLVHTSRLPLGTPLEDESLEVGNEIQGWVHEVESKRRRLSLSLRKVAGGDPWRDVTKRYPEGEIVKGKVERLAKFGVFIELEPGLTGLLPLSLIGGGGNPRRQYHPGKEVSVRVLSVDRGRRRISLGTETSKAEGSAQDYKEYLKSQSGGESSGLNAMEAAFAKLKEQSQAQQ